MNRQGDSVASRAHLVRPILVGLGCAVAAGTVLLLGVAALMAVLTLPTALAVPLALGVVAVASLVGGFVTARLSRERGLWYGAGLGLAFFLFLAVMGMAVSAEVFGVAMLWRLVVAVGCGALGGVLGVNVK